MSLMWCWPCVMFPVWMCMTKSIEPSSLAAVHETHHSLCVLVSKIMKSPAQTETKINTAQYKHTELRPCLILTPLNNRVSCVHENADRQTHRRTDGRTERQRDLVSRRRRMSVSTAKQHKNSPCLWKTSTNVCACTHVCLCKCVRAASGAETWPVRDYGG